LCRRLGKGGRERRGRDLRRSVREKGGDGSEVNEMRR
jgi:hypothetical protein